MKKYKISSIREKFSKTSGSVNLVRLKTVPLSETRLESFVDMLEGFFLSEQVII